MPDDQKATEHLEYLLREAQAGIREMVKNHSTIHAFDYGTDNKGVKYSFVMMVVPERSLDAELRKVKGLVKK